MEKLKPSDLNWLQLIAKFIVINKNELERRRRRKEGKNARNFYVVKGFYKSFITLNFILNLKIE